MRSTWPSKVRGRLRPRGQEGPCRRAHRVPSDRDARREGSASPPWPCRQRLAGGQLRAAHAPSASALDDADHVAGGDRLARTDREPCDDAVAMRADLVLHLHGLDDADDVAGRHLLAVVDANLEDRPLHRARHRVASRARPTARRGSLVTPSRELDMRRLRLEHANVEAPPVQLDGYDARPKPSVRRASSRAAVG